MNEIQDLYPLIKRLIEKEINNQTDTYTHNGSTWIIFTDEKKWVFELTKEKTLWYNYYFFTKIFKLIGLDVVENQHYITKWVEDNVINGVKSTINVERYPQLLVEDTIQNGVKDTSQNKIPSLYEIEDTIKNGVKDTLPNITVSQSMVEFTILNGIKETCEWRLDTSHNVKDTIQNGVKKTKRGILVQELSFEGVIENGVKHTDFLGPGRPEMIEKVIINGVKETESIASHRTWKSEQVIQNGIKETRPMDEWVNSKSIIEKTIQKGVKQTKTPGDGDIESTIKWMKENKTDSVPDMIDDIIENGIRKTEGGILFDESKIDTVISEGIKETHDDVMPHTGRVKGVIKNGVKVCAPSRTPLYNPMDFSVVYRENHRLDDVANVLEKGIKEVQPLPSQEGNMDWGNYYSRQEDRTKPHKEYVDDVIKKGYLCD